MFGTGEMCLNILETAINPPLTVMVYQGNRYGVENLILQDGTPRYYATTLV